MKITRRDFVKLTGAATAGLYVGTQVPWMSRAAAAPAAVGLSDPALQPKFVELAPNALDPGFKFEPLTAGRRAGNFNVYIRQSVQQTGLVSATSGKKLDTTIWGYGYDDDRGVTWPGRTFQVKRDEPTTVRWNNGLKKGNKPLEHLLPVDTSLHWAYSLPGYEEYSIKSDGVPIVTHLHGGHTDFEFDGNPEFFWSPDYEIVGPRWDALGITRLNVYAGLAGFYFVRDDDDTGEAGNPLGLPAFPYELAYAIQDRMFTDKGELFYPAFPGDPFYDDFITGEGAILPSDIFPGGGPTALAEFFGDHVVVNGKIWPKANVEPRNYRMHLLNGTDSRFMVLRFRRVPAGATTLDSAGTPIPFYVIGSDQGLASEAKQVDTLLSEPGSRYDIVFDFAGFDEGDRIIMENIGGDAPFGGAFGGDLDPEDLFPDRQTDRVMAFDVVLPLDPAVLDLFDPDEIDFGPVIPDWSRTRKVALFEGMDEFGRLQPLLGTAEPATDHLGEPIMWPNTPAYKGAGLVGQMDGSIAWHSPTTENPKEGTTERWDVFNVTGDAHPVHLHLVDFEILERREIVFDSNADDEGFIPDGETPANDGMYLVTQPVVQHNGLLGQGFRIVQPTNPDDAYGDVVDIDADDGYVENAPKDMVTALPGQITRIKATFDKPGRYVWHCHILSHEDHEMMRVLHVGEGAFE